MNATLIWDLPTRISHWILAAGVIFCAVVSLLLGEHSALFPLHSLVGLVIALLVLLRIVWGIIGSRHARFASFLFGPAAVVKYFLAVVSGKPHRHVGHNPGSAYAIFAMLGLVLLLGATGVLRATGSELAEEVHEIAAYALVGVVVAHLLGVALHTVKNRENITLGMIHGRKDTGAEHAIPSARPLAAFFMLVVVAAWAALLARGYTPATGSLRVPFTSLTLQLTEAEGGDVGEAQRDGDDDD
jgi:cytochrome b